jgi:hypothetical protein
LQYGQRQMFIMTAVSSSSVPHASALNHNQHGVAIGTGAGFF